MRLRVARHWAVVVLLLAGGVEAGVAQGGPPATSTYAAVPIDGTELRTIRCSRE